MTTGEDRPVVHDRRRVDPATGAVRPPPSEQSGAPGKAAQAAVAGVAKARAAREDGPKTRTDKSERTDKAERKAHTRAGTKEHERIKELETTVAERTADLQRLTAEYANYRKRVERDREAVKEQSKADVLGAFLDVLDDIGRAREHGELDNSTSRTSGTSGEVGEGATASGFRSVAEAIERTVSKFGLERYGEAGEPFDPTVHEALLHSHSADVSEPTCTTILQPGYRIGDRVLRAARVAVTDPEPYDPSGGETSD